MIQLLKLFQLSIIAEQTTPKLSGSKQQPFYYIHSIVNIVCSTGHRQGSLDDIQLVAGLGRKFQDVFTQMPGTLVGITKTLEPYLSPWSLRTSLQQGRQSSHKTAHRFKNKSYKR